MDTPIDHIQTLNYKGVPASMYTDVRFFPDTNLKKTKHNIDRYLSRK